MWPERRQGASFAFGPVGMALVTIVGFGGGGVLFMELLQDRSAWRATLAVEPVLLQLMLGGVAGVLIGRTAWAMVAAGRMTPLRERYAMLIGPLLARRDHRMLVSLCAGVGEELFFRGAVQWWLGIPLTAVVFVAIHGYLDPRDGRLFAYGAFLTVAMMLLGWMADRFGLLGPMLAHTVIDIILLEQLHRTWVAMGERATHRDPQSLA